MALEQDQGTTSAPNPGGGTQSAPSSSSPSSTVERGTPAARTSLRDTVLNAFTKIEKKNAAPPAKTSASPTAEPPSVEPQSKSPDTSSSQPGERVRGPDGKFQKADGTAEAQSPEKTAAQTPDQQQPATQQPQKKDEPKIDPPSGWNGAGKIEFGRLPKPVKEQIVADYKRQTEFHAAWQPFEQVMAPRWQALAQQYGHPAHAVSALFQLSDYANRDFKGFVQYLANQRGIDINTLFTRPAQTAQQGGEGQAAAQSEPAYVDPYVKSLETQLAAFKTEFGELKQRIQSDDQAQLANIQRSANTEVQAMAQNADEFPYLNDVRSDMAVLVQTGKANTLKEAYDKAVWLNPAVRDRMLIDRDQKRIAEQTRSVEDKRSAAVSINGAPGSAVPSAVVQPLKKQSVRDTVRGIADNIGFMAQSARI